MITPIERYLSLGLKPSSWIHRSPGVIIVVTPLVHKSLLNSLRPLQGDFKSCADILTCDRTLQKVTIGPIMPYRNVDIFREKGVKSFSKNV
jgi:hypothetical protein